MFVRFVQYIHLRSRQILVDVKAEAILLPIYGYLVPFHVSTVKNASRLEEYLRINFVTPTQMVAQTQVNSSYRDDGFYL